MDILYFKHLIVRTPFQRPAEALRGALSIGRRLRHTELHEIFAEPGRMKSVLKRTVRPTSNCLDVGAHIGSTLADLLRLAPRGKHYAFEPVPIKAEWLKRKFPEVEIVCAALADRDGRIDFKVDATRPGYSHISAAADDGQEANNCESVPCRRLDSVLPPDHRVDFIKVDVEGAEEQVLRGGRELIKRWKPAILFESGPEAAERYGMSHTSLFRLLTEDLGYEVFHLKDYLADRGPIDESLFDRAHQYPFQAFNYLASAKR